MPLKYTLSHFKEVQRFDQWWIWMILLGVTIIPIYGIYEQVIMGHSFGGDSMSDIGLTLVFLLVLLLDLLFIYVKLITEISLDHINIKFLPFAQKSIRWRDIESAEVVDYGFLGYGIRLFTRYGTVYNGKGSKGLSLRLKNGKKFLIGTQKPIELIQFLTARAQWQAAKNYI